MPVTRLEPEPEAEPVVTAPAADDGPPASLSGVTVTSTTVDVFAATQAEADAIAAERGGEVKGFD